MKKHGLFSKRTLSIILFSVIFATTILILWEPYRAHADENWQYMFYDGNVYTVGDPLGISQQWARIITDNITAHDGAEAAAAYWAGAKAGDFNAFYAMVGNSNPTYTRKEYMMYNGQNYAKGDSPQGCTFLGIECSIHGTTMAELRQSAADQGYPFTDSQSYSNFLLAVANGKATHPGFGKAGSGYKKNNSSSQSAPTEKAEAQPAPEPEKPTEFTVEDADFDGWATQIVNVRDGADQTWEKIGALAPNEHVRVTGIASTGWYRIMREDDSEGYVANAFITKEDSNGKTQEEVMADAGSSDEEPIVEETKPEETVEVQAPAEEPAEPEETIEETSKDVAGSDHETTPVENDEFSGSVQGPNMAVIIGIAVAALAVIIGIVVVVKKKKE